MRQRLIQIGGLMAISSITTISEPARALDTYCTFTATLSEYDLYYDNNIQIVIDLTNNTVEAGSTNTFWNYCGTSGSECNPTQSSCSTSGYPCTTSATWYVPAMPSFQSATQLQSGVRQLTFSVTNGSTPSTIYGVLASSGSGNAAFGGIFEGNVGYAMEAQGTLSGSCSGL